MKVVLRYNIKKKELDMFAYPDPGPVPPIVDPPMPEEPKDTEPPKPKPKAS